jgi:hypothetical protein
MHEGWVAMKYNIRLIALFLVILFNMSCTHPETKEKTDPFTAFWYSLDGPSNWRTGSFYEDYTPNYHHNHHYQRVIIQDSRPRFASDIEVKGN